jgi:hypothetical protein
MACERFYEAEELLRMRDLHIENLNQQVELHAKAIEERAMVCACMSVLCCVYVVILMGPWN